jgi:hypothetical protein
VNRNNVVLTGTGRSGTTLVCYLLNKLPNTVALSEPIAPGKFEKCMPDREAACDQIELYYRRMRRRARKEGIVISKHVGGAVPDNTKGMVEGVRRRIAEKGEIILDKELSAGFTLAIKQPGMFTALLPILAKRFPCYAVVRNPLAVMASVKSIQGGKEKTRGRSAVLRYDPNFLRHTGDREANTPHDRLTTRFMRFDAYFDRYQKVLPRDHILRYEDIVSSGGRALKVIHPAALELDEPLESKNLNPLYDRKEMLRLGERLLQSEGAYWNFYSRESVEELLAQLT